MKKILIALLCLTITGHNYGQTIEKQKILYGTCNKAALQQDPFNKWFNQGYENYQPNASALSTLKLQKIENIQIKIFFGTWCGDSKREVPRFLKLLDAISFPEKKIQLIALGNNDSLPKQSPGHEEAAVGIFRVPTMIIYKNGIEVNRINEFPVFSLERDLLSILNGSEYTPNYRSFYFINRCLQDGTMLDSNISIVGLSRQLKPLINDENELNSLGYLLIKQEKKKEALAVFRMNALIFPNSANVISSLGEGYMENGDPKKAVAFLERAVELNENPASLKEILELLYKAKQL